MKTYYTNAEIEYDGFGTKRTGEKIVTKFGFELEKVEIVEKHENWQVSRYSSGMKSIISKEEIKNYLI